MSRHPKLLQADNVVNTGVNAVTLQIGTGDTLSTVNTMHNCKTEN